MEDEDDWCFEHPEVPTVWDDDPNPIIGEILDHRGLVQFRGLLNAFNNTVESYVGAFGGEASQDRLMASAILVFFPVFGFLASYLGTRTMVTILLEAISGTDGEEHPPPKGETSQGPM